MNGFAGVLHETIFNGERYAVFETALGSGNGLLRFRSNNQGLAYALFKAKLPNAVGTRPAAWAGVYAAAISPSNRGKAW